MSVDYRYTAADIETFDTKFRRLHQEMQAFNARLVRATDGVT